jgi:hypothetical protein
MKQKNETDFFFSTGRMFDYHVLDMFEFSIDSLIPMEKFKTPKITIGTKPSLVFVGEPFDIDPEYMRLKCLFIGMHFFKYIIPIYKRGIIDTVRGVAAKRCIVTE